MSDKEFKETALRLGFVKDRSKPIDYRNVWLPRYTIPKDIPKYTEPYWDRFVREKMAEISEELKYEQERLSQELR